MRATRTFPLLPRQKSCLPCALFCSCRRRHSTSTPPHMDAWKTASLPAPGSFFLIWLFCTAILSRYFQPLPGIPEPRRAHLVIEASAAVSMPIHERKGCTYILISHRRSERLLARARPDLFAAGVHRTPPTGSHSWRRACCLVRCRVSLRTSWVFCATAFGNAPQESVTKKGKLALPGVSH